MEKKTGVLTVCRVAVDS